MVAIWVLFLSKCTFSFKGMNGSTLPVYSLHNGCILLGLSCTRISLVGCLDLALVSGLLVPFPNPRTPSSFYSG